MDTTTKGAGMTTERIEFVDHGVQGEFGFFGKVVAASDVRGMSEAEIEAEIAAMKAEIGDHVIARRVEQIPAAALSVSEREATLRAARAIAKRGSIFAESEATLVSIAEALVAAVDELRLGARADA